MSFTRRGISRIFKSPGLFVAFYGVDGSGKSTQVKILCDKISGLYSDKIRLFHFRPKIVYLKSNDTIVSDPHNQLKSNYLRSF